MAPSHAATEEMPKEPTCKPGGSVPLYFHCSSDPGFPPALWSGCIRTELHRKYAQEFLYAVCSCIRNCSDHYRGFNASVHRGNRSDLPPGIRIKTPFCNRTAEGCSVFQESM